MKVFLMYKDRDFDLARELPWNEQALTRDLELDTLFGAMSRGDNFLFEVAQKAILSSENDLDTISYRQDILRDCLNNSSVIRSLYDITVEAIENKKKHFFGIFLRYHSSVLYSSIEIMRMFMDMLGKLRAIADEHAAKFESVGFTAFFTMLQKELNDEYFARVRDHLEELKFPAGALISARLAAGNKGADYVLHKSKEDRKKSWIERILPKKTSGYTFNIHPRDESGPRYLGEIRDRGINLVANDLAQSDDHILSFFSMLQTELAFYIGCLNLHERLALIEEPVSFPRPVASAQRRHAFKELYDVCLALKMKQKVVGNDLNAGDKNLAIITGANQGGKSTFLRSIGLAQLMMQCGMFVPAESFFANVCESLITHYKREEDVAMESGKLDEELKRMSEIVDHIKSNSIVLFNESFAATNEREGSEIAGQIVRALIERNIKVFFVTHLYEFAQNFFEKETGETIFLRADRLADGRQTFKLIEGRPLQTSFGKDLYDRIFNGA
ncbi:MAG: hypothetical protein M0Z75_15510 [Nitrospiraceae bacterium]|nr:hypothetical protein [Nitrospiraceae bacterium]